MYKCTTLCYNRCDELNYLQPGKNFEWPEFPEGAPGASAGLRLYRWRDVISPTGLAFHDGSGFGEDYENSLFLSSYTFGEIRRLPMSGPLHANVDDEIVFLRLTVDPDHKPIALMIASDGAIWFSTFDAVWRIDREAE